MLRICARNIQSLAFNRTVIKTSTVNRGFCEKITKSETLEPEHAEEKKTGIELGGFAKAFEKHSLPQEKVAEEKLPDLPFATLLRNSKFINVSNLIRRRILC